MNDSNYPRWAYIYWNEKFLCIETYSGRGRYQVDPGVMPIFLPPEVKGADLGEAVLDALSRSRLIAPDELGAFFDIRNTQAHYERWVSDTMLRYEYKSRRAFFKGMLSCGARQQCGSITFSPSRKDKLEAWGRTKDDILEGMTDEVISDADSPFLIGEALRRAMNRCR